MEVSPKMPESRAVSGAQLGAATGATACDNLAATNGCHAGTETVTALAYQVAGLKRAFHGLNLQ
jgi:hypothetical protein